MMSLEYNVKVNFQLQAVQHIAYSSASCDVYSHRCERYQKPVAFGTINICNYVAGFQVGASCFVHWALQ